MLAVRGADAQVLDLGGDIEETFSAEKVAVARPWMPSGYSQETMKLGVGFTGAKPEILDPPSALNPQATATASSNVDFPEPFSPMKNVTAG